VQAGMTKRTYRDELVGRFDHISFKVVDVHVLPTRKPTEKACISVPSQNSLANASPIFAHAFLFSPQILSDYGQFQVSHRST